MSLFYTGSSACISHAPRKKFWRRIRKSFEIHGRETESPRRTRAPRPPRARPPRATITTTTPVVQAEPAENSREPCVRHAEQAATASATRDGCRPSRTKTADELEATEQPTKKSRGKAAQLPHPIRTTNVKHESDPKSTKRSREATSHPAHVGTTSTATASHNDCWPIRKTNVTHESDEKATKESGKNIPFPTYVGPTSAATARHRACRTINPTAAIIVEGEDTKRIITTCIAPASKLEFSGAKRTTTNRLFAGEAYFRR
ncbi:hypothetical protein PZA11_005519 [Diplocarpon coronariae]